MIREAVLDVTAVPANQHTLNSPTHDTWAVVVDRVVTEYRWDAVVGYWRVIKSTAYGTALYGDPPDSVEWRFGENCGKPLWVAAMEHENYPREIW